MTVKLKSIIQAIPALAKLSAGDLTLRTAYDLQKSVNVLQKEADFFTERRDKIFNKYGERQNDGTFRFEKENENTAVAELEALLSLEVTPDCERVRIPLTEDVKISANDLGVLLPFVEFAET